MKLTDFVQKITAGIEFRASIGYLIGNYLIKGIGIITVPLFARLLTVYDYGVYNTFLAYEGIVYIIISLALHSSLKNASIKFRGEIDKYTSSVSIISIIVGSILLALSFLYKDSIAVGLKLDPRCIPLVVVFSFCSGIILLYQNRLALDYRYREYIILALVNAITSVFLSVLFILYLFPKERYIGRIGGCVITSIFISAYVLLRLYIRNSPRINKEYWSYGLRISLPIVPHGLSQIVLLQFDRIMISNAVGSAEAGLYSFTYTLFSLIQITASSLDNAYSPWVFKKLNNNDGNETKHKVQAIGTVVMIIIAVVVLFCMLLSKEIVLLFGGKKYMDSIPCTFPVLLAGFFAMSYNIPAVMEYYYEKTRYIAIGTSCAAVLNVILNAIAIPRFGYIAAGYTTLFCYIIYFLAHIIIAKRLFGYSSICIMHLLATISLLAVAYITGLLFTDIFIVRLIMLIIFLTVSMIMLVSLYKKNSIS